MDPAAIALESFARALAAPHWLDALRWVAGYLLIGVGLTLGTLVLVGLLVALWEG